MDLSESPSRSTLIDVALKISTELIADIDRWLHAEAARFTGGLSPMALVGVYLDWATHLASSPGRRLELGHPASRDLLRFAVFGGGSFHR